MPGCRLHHRYTLCECRGTLDGRIAERKLLSANDLPLLVGAMSRLNEKGWLVRIWDEERAEYLS